MVGKAKIKSELIVTLPPSPLPPAVPAVAVISPLFSKVRVLSTSKVIFPPCSIAVSAVIEPSFKVSSLA
ncbi:MAG: hypothetical protein AB4368_27715 [Xenococcaceae cyanobacterium]